jgi:hypothetical protein
MQAIRKSRATHSIDVLDSHQQSHSACKHVGTCSALRAAAGSIAATGHEWPLAATQPCNHASGPPFTHRVSPSSCSKPIFSG